VQRRGAHSANKIADVLFDASADGKTLLVQRQNRAQTVLDMLAVWFELRFGQKPLLAFGMLGFIAKQVLTWSSVSETAA
jgi:hypothetical protein